MKNIRELSYKCIKKIFEKKSYANIVLLDFSKGLNKLERSFLRELVYGVIENYMYYDWLLSKFSKIKLKKIDENVKIIIKIGMYQILELDRIPDSAAVNESVKLIAKYSNKGAKGFTNAILRNIVRLKNKLPEIDKENILDCLSIKYSYPKWLIEMWIKQYGEKFTEELLIANSKRHYLNVRINTIKGDNIEVEKFLNDSGYIFEKSDYSKYSYKIKNPAGILESEIYKEGKIDIQDLSSILSVEILDPKVGERVLDVCAAPGGKTGFIAQIMENEGNISARDIYQSKLNEIDKKMQRLGVSIVKTQKIDALIFNEKDVEKWDKCLIDAPCSALGLIRNKPEIKYFRDESIMKKFPEIQMKILRNVSNYVRKGGSIVYSTCSINKAENEKLIEQFLKENGEFELEKFPENFLIRKNIKNINYGMLQLSPNENDTNGFFISKIKRKC